MEEQLKTIKEFEKLVTKGEIANILNEAALRYASVSLSQDDPCSVHQDTAEDIYWMMEVRDFFRKL